MMEHLNFCTENFLEVTQDLEKVSLFREMLREIFKKKIICLI